MGLPRGSATHTPQLDTHLPALPPSVCSPVAGILNVRATRLDARPPGPNFLRFLTPDPEQRLVELREGRAENAD